MSDPPTSDPTDLTEDGPEPDRGGPAGEQPRGPDDLAKTLESAASDAPAVALSDGEANDDTSLDRPTIPQSMPLPGFTDGTEQHDGPPPAAAIEPTASTTGDTPTVTMVATPEHASDATASTGATSPPTQPVSAPPAAPLPEALRPKPPTTPPPPPPPAPTAAEVPGGQPGPTPAAATGDAPTAPADEQPTATSRAQLGSIPDDDPAAEQGPPGIPSLVKPAGDEDRPSEPTRAHKRSRKGKRRTVTIPDDAVPATPTPAAVDAATATSTPSGEPPAAAPGGTPALAAEPEATEATETAGAAPAHDDTSESGDTPSAHGIFTDEQAIGVLRPIQVMSDLPPVANRAVDIIGADGAVALADDDLEPDVDSGPAHAPPTPSPPPATGLSPTSARRPLPPKRSDRPASPEQLDTIEEIIPDRMSLPGLVSDPAVGTIGSPVSAGEHSERRPLPPPRGLMSSDPNLMLGPEGTPQPAPAMVGGAPAFDEHAMSEVESTAAAAEAAAREAEALAREAEARAQEAELKAAAARAKAAERAKRPWWVRLFEDEFLRTLDNPKKHDVKRESDFIEKSLRLKQGSRILDLACGHGVYAVELASRGYQLVGVDLSSTMLALANEYNTKRNTSVSFIKGDMRKLALDGVFDGIYCWSSSFGYFDDHNNQEVLKRVARALRPGGRFVLDMINRDFVAPRSPSMAWFEKPGCVCMDEMHFDFFTSRLITKRMVMFETGRSTEIECSMRLYPLNELGRMLSKLGLKVLEVSGHRAHRNAYFGCESPRVIITSERTQETQ